MILRPYQQAAISALYSYFAAHDGNPLIVMPTASGKSPTMGMFIKEVIQSYDNQKILMVTHVQELIEQNAAELQGIWPQVPLGIYSAGLNRRDTIFPITMAGIQSVYRHAEKFGFVHLMLIDEAHLLSNEDSSMYRIFITELKKYNPNLKVIGFTATPYRTKGGPLTAGEKALFTDVAYEVEISDLIRQGYICPLVSKSSAVQADLSNVHKRGGEFIAKEVEEAFNVLDLTERALDVVLDLGRGRRAGLVFCSGVAHAQDVAERIRQRGKTCETVTSDTPKEERARILEDFKAGKLDFVTNVGVLTTGFNAPNCDLLVLLRATNSPGLFCQMLGRGFRPNGNGMAESIQNGKTDCLVLDFGGNLMRFGPVNMLDPKEPRVIPGKECPECGEVCAGLALYCRACMYRWGEMPTKTCHKCGQECHAAARMCKNETEAGICNTEFPKSTMHDVYAADGTIVAMLPSEAGEDYPVSHLEVIEHRKSNTATPSLKVTYYSGTDMQKFSEWVCFEHQGFPRRKAAQWWAARTELGSPTPQSVAEALGRMEECFHPQVIRVKREGKYFRIDQARDFIDRPFDVLIKRLDPPEGRPYADQVPF